MADGTESRSSAKVRALIFAYESQSSSTKPLEESYERPRAKSIGNALSYKLFRQPNIEFHNMMDIEKELIKIEAHLNYYEVYDKETHVAFQEQLFNVLTSIVSIDPEDQEGNVQMKKKLIQETQKLATVLNSRLPYDGNHSYKGTRKTYSTSTRKEEAVVSTTSVTSVRSAEHRAVLVSQNSSLNGGFKSEESLNSTKDSVDLSSKFDESSSIDLSYLEEKSQSSTLSPQEKILDEPHSSMIPSVSKLKKFFSFRKETKPEVASTSYSGISRSQSLNIKTNKYTIPILKRDKHEEARKNEETISENDEVNEKTYHTNKSIDISSMPDSSEASIYLEPVQEIQEYREVEKEATHNVSVSRLKSLFEKNQTESNEGLGLLTQKQNEFSSDFNIPFTAMNLGAYRLKRTISGNYMNFTGLIRNVDVNKKGELSKSKSLSDLKITNFSYGTRDYDDNGDLSKEIDDNDDDFEHVSINIGKETKEVNNNAINIGTTNKNITTSYETLIKVPIELRAGAGNTSENSNEKVATNEHSQRVHRENETIVLSKTVESLKQTFENLSTSTGQKSKETDKELKHVLYKTVIEPVPTTTTLVVEPVLKVPIQLRTGYTNESYTKEVKEQKKVTGSIEVNADIKPILRRTVGPTPSQTDSSEEPVLKVPIQLRSGFANVSYSQKVTENSHDIKTTVKDNTKISVQQQKDVELKIPNHLEIGVNNTQEQKHVTSYINKTVGSISSSTNGLEEPALKVPVHLKSNLANVSNSQENTERSFEIKTTVKENTTMRVQERNESELKSPIESRVGVNNIHENLAVKEKSRNIHKSVETLSPPGTMETLIETFEQKGDTSNINVNVDIKHQTVGSIPNSTNGSEEPVLKVPIQLRTDFENMSHSQEVAENHETKTFTVQEQKEPELQIPIQLGVEVNTLENLTIKENSSNIENTVETLALPVNEEILHEPFEQKEPTGRTDVYTDIQHILHRIVGPIAESNDETEEPELKVPIQLRTGFKNVEHSHEVTGHVHEISETTETRNSRGQEEQLLKIPIQLKVGVDHKKDNSSGAVEIIESSSEGVNINVPLHHSKTEVVEYSEATENSYEHHSTGQITNDSVASFGSVEALKQTFQHIGNGNDSETTVTQTTETAVLKVPVQLKADFENAQPLEFEFKEHSSNDKTDVNHKIEIVGKNTQLQEPLLKIPIQLREENNITATDEALDAKMGTMKRARIEEKTESFMKILESPTEFSTILSSQGQYASSASNVSYSEKRSVQHTTTTQVSQRIVTSSSSSSFMSQQSSKNSLQVLEEPVSYSLLSSTSLDSPNEESSVTITEVNDDVDERRHKVNLNVSQENIIAEILKDSDSLENIDEEFERMLEENSK